MTSNLVSLQRTIRTFTELCEKREIVQWRHIGDLFMRWAAMKAESRIVAVRELTAIVERHREGTWQLQTPYFWKLITEMLIATGEFTLAKELLDEASHLADVAPQNWVKPELYRLYAVLAERKCDPAGFAPEHWLKRSLAQAQEHGERYAELCAARDLGQLYARRGEHQAARQVLTAVSASLTAGSDDLVVRQVEVLLDELSSSGSS